MQITNVLAKICDCLELPYFILILLLALAIGFKRTKTSALLLVIGGAMIFWRSFFAITSSRYCISIITFSIILSAIAMKEFMKKRSFAWIFTVFVFLIFYNTIKSISSFRNSYIFDVQEIINCYQPHYKQVEYYINNKEYMRFCGEDNKKENKHALWDSNEYTIMELLNNVSFLGKDIIIISRKTSEKKIVPPSGTSLKCISKHNTDYTHTKRIGIHRYIPKEVYSVNEDMIKNENVDNRNNALIKNGDIESVQSIENKKRLMEKWIKQGASFYSSDEIKLPEYKEMFQMWKDVNESNYPIVFADEEKNICGKYSLHIVLPTNNISNIYFFNKIKTVPGTLSFLVKSLNDQCEFTIARYDFLPQKKGTRPPFSTFTLNISDKNVHKVEITLDEQTIRGEESLFFIFGNNIDIIVDNIIFVPST